jgi:DNA-binding transcriptional regulator YhcF (GntR family)
LIEFVGQYGYLGTELAQNVHCSHWVIGGIVFTIDSHSSTPPYEQLRMQIIEAVRIGALASGARMPTVRKLADELSLAPNTVARAYRELESDEVIETRGRHGSFIAASGDPTHRQAQLAATAYAERVSQLGIDSAEALRLVTTALRTTR